MFGTDKKKPVRRIEVELSDGTRFESVDNDKEIYYGTAFIQIRFPKETIYYPMHMIRQVRVYEDVT